MITAQEASDISKATLSVKHEAMKQKCQKVLDDLDNKISEAAERGEFTCILFLSKGDWPDILPVYYFELISNKKLTEYGIYISRQLIDAGYTVDINEGRILVSWLEKTETIR